MPEYLPERYQRPKVDAGHIEVDELISDLEDDLDREYSIAAQQMRKKADEYFKTFKEIDAKKRKELENGTITKKEYQAWRLSHMLTGKRWFEYADILATDLTNVNIIADSIVYGYLADAYCIGINYGVYNVETSGLIDTSWTLYDKQTVERLIKEKPDLLPKPTVNIPKSKIWSKQKLNSEVTQGIMQGESIPQIAQRLSEVADMSENQAISTARTMVTNAENAGRNDGYKRCEAIGVDLVIEWAATLDHRTRLSHRLLDGQRKKVDDFFEIDGIKLKYPADLGGKNYKVPPEMIYNCRCTMLAWTKGFEGDKVKSSPKLKGMSYDAWQKAKGDNPQLRAEMNIKRDHRIYEEYTSLKLSGMPKKFEDFQNLKYQQPEKWENLKKQARIKRDKLRKERE